jgi:uncharacterized protein (TIGR02996 family)
MAAGIRDGKPERDGGAMTALAGILQAIHDDPGEETNWLVLADWLEENDDGRRAELLRLQRGLRTDLAPAKRRQTEERIRSLLAAGVKPCVPTRTSALGLELALIPAGTFRMGSPVREPRRMDDEHLRTVTLTRHFYLGTHLVTQAQYQHLMGSNPSHFTPKRRTCRKEDTKRFPVDSVTWLDAQLFCSALTEHDRTLAGNWAYRLPTEAEWEHACRAWLSSRWPFHHGSALTPQMANFDGHFPYPPGTPDPHGLFLGRPTVVGSYVPNALGLYDMHGNLDEWCLDYDRDLDDAGDEVDPQGPSTGEDRIVRGGSWRGQGEDCRAAVRIGEDPERGKSHIGFRVALVRVGRG